MRKRKYCDYANLRYDENIKRYLVNYSVQKRNEAIQFAIVSLPAGVVSAKEPKWGILTIYVFPSKNVN